MIFSRNKGAEIILQIFSEKIVSLYLYNYINIFIYAAQYYPHEKCFGREFLLGILRGRKKLLPPGFFADLICYFILKV